MRFAVSVVLFRASHNVVRSARIFAKAVARGNTGHTGDSQSNAAAASIGSGMREESFTTSRGFRVRSRMQLARARTRQTDVYPSRRYNAIIYVRCYRKSGICTPRLRFFSYAFHLPSTFFDSTRARIRAEIRNAS